jgi:hypothetical protein
LGRPQESAHPAVKIDAAVGELLHAVLFLAAECHYFDEDWPKFQAIVESIRAREGSYSP